MPDAQPPGRADERPAGSESAPATTTTQGSGYTAVVYVHGMGSQRRYEEVSNLVASLDAYAYADDDEDDVGRLSRIVHRSEPGREPDCEDVSYLLVERLRKVNGKPQSDTYRFYEVYWAPLTAGSVTVREVITWMFKRVANPVGVLLAPWRERARLRRAELYHLGLDQPAPAQGEAGVADVQELLKIYDRFQEPGARRRFPDGSFRGFLELVRGSGGTDKLVALAKQWRSASVLREVGVLLYLLTLALVFVMAFVVLFLAVAFVIELLHKAGLPVVAGADDQVKLPGRFRNPGTVVAGVAILAGVIGITRFLSDYLGDVLLWATYQETDEKYRKRKEILESTMRVLQHVLRDGACGRVIVVAHSLGATIAHDALLKLRHYNEARMHEPTSPLDFDKLDLLITFGSPIDKIHYFFESQKGGTYVYDRMVETVRGDLGTEPFAKNRKPRVHWINFWDRADIIGGSLHTPNSPVVAEYGVVVDNVEMASYWFPAPGASHGGYLGHRGVVRAIFEATFDRKYSFENAPLRPGAGYDYRSQFLGPGTAWRSRWWFHVPALCLPWLVVATALSFWLNGPAALRVLALAASLAIAMPLLGWWRLGAVLGHREPVAGPQPPRVAVLPRLLLWLALGVAVGVGRNWWDFLKWSDDVTLAAALGVLVLLLLEPLVAVVVGRRRAGRARRQLRASTTSAGAAGP